MRLDSEVAPPAVYSTMYPCIGGVATEGAVQLILNWDWSMLLKVGVEGASGGEPIRWTHMRSCVGDPTAV